MSEIKKTIEQAEPLISVIITNYNYGEFVTEAMESILSQTYPNIELIVINDGSTDNSDKVIKSVISKNVGRNIRYVTRENKGVVYTRNEGIELARGEYISYLDADDYFNDDYISKSYEVAKESGADVIYPNWHFVGDWLGRPDTNFPEFSAELLQLQKLHCTPASLIRKQSIGARRFETEKVAEDWDFFIGLSLSGVKFKLAKDNHINYRIRQGTRGSKNDPREDTKYFVQILQKYKAEYGDMVVDPRKLIKFRHPNIVMRVLSMRYPKVVIDSVKQDGVQKTGRKMLRKVAKRNHAAWAMLGNVRNAKYASILKSFKVDTTEDARLAVVVHLYYPDRWAMISEKLSNIDVPFDLFVSVREQDKDIELGTVSKYHGKTNIISFPNRGRDVLPFMLISQVIIGLGQYDYFLKLHSKKSLHRADGDEWLESLLDQLIPSDISDIIRVLKKKATGVVGPADHVVSLSRYMGDNKGRITSVIEHIADSKMAEDIIENAERYPFFGGTMFWCRTDFAEVLLSSGITPADFNTEDGQVDGTTAHAIERLLGKALHKASSKKMYAVKGAVVKEVADGIYDSEYKHVG